MILSEALLTLSFEVNFKTTSATTLHRHIYPNWSSRIAVSFSLTAAPKYSTQRRVSRENLAPKRMTREIFQGATSGGARHRLAL